MAKKSPITGLDPGDPLGLFTVFGDWSPSDVNSFDPLDRWDDKWKAIGWEPYKEGGKFNFFDPLDVTDRVADTLGVDSSVVGTIVNIVGSLFGAYGALGASAATGGSEGRGTEGALNSLGAGIAGGYAGGLLGNVLGGVAGEAGQQFGSQLGNAGVQYLASRANAPESVAAPSAPASVGGGTTTLPSGGSGGGGTGLNISNATAPQIYPWRVKRG